jgi:hypothetical protein
MRLDVGVASTVRRRTTEGDEVLRGVLATPASGEAVLQAVIVVAECSSAAGAGVVVSLEDLDSETGGDGSGAHRGTLRDHGGVALGSRMLGPLAQARVPPWGWSGSSPRVHDA